MVLPFLRPGFLIGLSAAIALAAILFGQEDENSAKIKEEKDWVGWWIIQQPDGDALYINIKTQNRTSSFFSGEGSNRVEKGEWKYEGNRIVLNWEGGYKDVLASTSDRYLYYTFPPSAMPDISGAGGIMARRLQKERIGSLQIPEGVDLSNTVARGKEMPPDRSVYIGFWTEKSSRGGASYLYLKRGGRASRAIPGRRDTDVESGNWMIEGENAYIVWNDGSRDFIDKNNDGYTLRGSVGSGREYDTRLEKTEASSARDHFNISIGPASTSVDFLGFWALKDQNGDTYYVEVGHWSQATRHLETEDSGIIKETGRWTMLSNGVHITWEDGTQDTLRITPQGIKLSSFAPGAPISGIPLREIPADLASNATFDEFEDAVDEKRLKIQRTELALRRAKEEAQKKAAQEEARARALAEARRQAEDEARRMAEEDARIKARDLARQKDAQKKKRIAEEKAQRRAEELERKRALAEEQRIAKAEARRKSEMEAAQRIADEKARRMAELEAKNKTKEEARRLAELEAKRKKAQEAARQLAEMEAQRKTEATRQLAEMEAQRKKAEEDARRLAEAQTQRKAEEEAKRLAEAQAKREALGHLPVIPPVAGSSIAAGAEVWQVHDRDGDPFKIVLNPDGSAISTWAKSLAGRKGQVGRWKEVKSGKQTGKQIDWIEGGTYVIASTKKGYQLSAYSSSNTKGTKGRPVSGAEQTDGSSVVLWDVVFADEFEDATLDAGKWNTKLPWSQIINNEQGGYSPGGVSIADGNLVLTATQSTINYAGQDLDYTTGAINTYNLFEQAYGYFEIRAKVPEGRGLWPAFWLFTKNGPPEIDVLDVLSGEPDRAHFNSIYLEPGGGTGKQNASHKGIDFSRSFHTLGLEWSPGALIYYIDGKEVNRFTMHIPDQPMFLVASLAVGGDWPGPVSGWTAFPARMQIDFIRVYKRR